MLSAVGWIWGMAWSPDEGQLAVSAQEGLILVSRYGQFRRVVDRAEFQGGMSVRRVIRPCWFSGGGTIGGQDFYIDNVGTLWFLDAASGRRQQVGVHVPGPYDKLPHLIDLDGQPVVLTSEVYWSPDGRYMALTIRDMDQPVGVVAGAAGPGKTNEAGVVIGSCHVWASPVAWSPDNRFMLVSMTLRSPDEASTLPRRPQLWVWERASGKLSLVAAGGTTYRAVWGDDGVLWYVESEERVLVGVRLRGLQAGDRTPARLL